MVTNTFLVKFKFIDAQCGEMCKISNICLLPFLVDKKKL
jgi:hypothetical protein